MRKKLTTILVLLGLIAGLQFIMAPQTSLVGQTYKILFRRGLAADLPTLSAGEPGFATDTRELYIGSSVGNIRVHGDYVTPEMYGAKGDGVTDDTAAIQAAITAGAGGTVVFSNKTYAISSTLTLNTNSSYVGPSGSSYLYEQTHPTAGYGACLKWIGPNTDVMVEAFDFRHIYWSGIDLDGVDWADGITGFKIYSDNAPDSQYMTMEKFRIFNVDYGIKLGNEPGVAGTQYNVSPVYISDFLIYLCNYGIYVNSSNALDLSHITRAQIFTGNAGIYLERSGFLEISNLAIHSLTDSPSVGALIYIDNNTPIIIRQTQGEIASGTGVGWYHIKTSPLSSYNPITLVSNVFDFDIQINGGRKITSIGNSFESASARLVGNGIYWLSCSDYFTSGDFVYAGSGNVVTFLQKYTTGAAHEFFKYVVDGTDQAEFSGYGNLDINGVYSIDGTAVLDSSGVAAKLNSVLDYAGEVQHKAINTDDGAGSFVSMYIGNADTGQAGLQLYALGTGFTTSGGYVQDGGAIGTGTELSGGLSIITRHALGDIRLYAGQYATPDVTLKVGGNLGVGQSTFGTSATKTLAVASGTAPSTSPADAFQLYSADAGGVVGQAGPHLRTEGGGIFGMRSDTGTTLQYVYQKDDLADDGTVNLPDATSGMVLVSCNGEAGMWLVQADGTVTKISGSTNTVATDTDANLCVYDGGTGAIVKNRLGATGEIRIVYYYN